MDERDRLDRFTLLGGPLHRLGTRLGLVRAGSNTLPLGLALSALFWLPLVILGVAEGGADRLFSIGLVAAHVRLLVAIPLFFLCESWLDPPAATFIPTLRRSGIVPEQAASAYERILARAARLTDSWTADAVCLVVALLVSVYGYTLPFSGSTAVPGHGVAGHGLTAQWYWSVCLPFFRFLMFRWLWRIALWAWLLWRVSRLDLASAPGAPGRRRGAVLPRDRARALHAADLSRSRRSSRRRSPKSSRRARRSRWSIRRSAPCC